MSQPRTIPDPLPSDWVPCEQAHPGSTHEEWWATHVHAPAEPQPQTAVAQALERLIRAVERHEAGERGAGVAMDNALLYAKKALASQPAAQSGPAGGEGLDIERLRIAYEAGRTAANFEDMLNRIQRTTDVDATEIAAEYARLSSKAPATEGET